VQRVGARKTSMASLPERTSRSERRQPFAGPRSVEASEARTERSEFREANGERAERSSAAIRAVTRGEASTSSD
jgi:hypothetical protein